MTFRALFLITLSPSLFAQSLILRTDNQLAGEILAISPAGGVTVKTPHSPDVIHLRMDAIRQLILDDSDSDAPFQTERLVLQNGDLLPGSLVSLSRETIVYKGLFEETLSIPRSQVKILRLGVNPQALIYEGPAPLTNWTGNAVDYWSFSDARDQLIPRPLVLSKNGSISQDVGLVQQFTLAFNLAWTNQPDMRISFCENLAEETSKDGRYYLAINSGGLQIRREMGEKGGINSLIDIKNPEAFDDKAVAVELRFDGILGTMALYLDEEFIREIRVSIKPPTGTGISISQNSDETMSSELSDLQIKSWDTVSLNTIGIENEENAADGLIAIDGARMSGTLIEMRLPTPEPVIEVEEKVEEPALEEGENTDTEAEAEAQAEAEAEAEVEAKTETETETEAGAQAQEEAPLPQAPTLQDGHFVLESPLSEEEIVISYNQARILLFKSPPKPEEAVEEPLPLYEIEFQNDGRLSADEVTMDAQFLTIVHPILGELKFDKSSVKSLRTLQLVP